MPTHYSMQEMIDREEQAGNYDVIRPKRKRSAFTPQQGVVTSGRISSKLANMKQNGASLSSPARGTPSVTFQKKLPSPPRAAGTLPKPRPGSFEYNLTEDFENRFWNNNARFAKKLLGD